VEFNHRHADFQSGDGCSRGFLINHLQRLPTPLPRHTTAHSWHTLSELVTFVAPEPVQRLIFETAERTGGVGPLTETLGWAKPAYRTEAPDAIAKYKIRVFHRDIQSERDVTDEQVRDPESRIAEFREMLRDD
jgi:hypothetical protein